MYNKDKSYLTQFARTEELNKRIYARNNASETLDLPLSFRSIETRTTLPIAVKMPETQKISNDNNTFIPGNNSNTYYYPYGSSIDTNSCLLNITNTLSSETEIHNKYIPNTNSDLYLSNYNTDVVRDTLKTSSGIRINNSTEFFNNHTRQQLKNS